MGMHGAQQLVTELGWVLLASPGFRTQDPDLWAALGVTRTRVGVAALHRHRGWGEGQSSWGNFPGPAATETQVK